MVGNIKKWLCKECGKFHYVVWVLLYGFCKI
jgi:hypothetical protein